MEEFECHLSVDAPPRFGVDPYGEMKKKHDEFWALTLGQEGDTDNVSNLLAKCRPRVVVDTDGGQCHLLLYMGDRLQPHRTSPLQWGG